MFKFLKEKLKNAISKISETVEREGKVEETVVGKPVESKEEKGFFAKLKETIVGKKEEKELSEEKKPEIEVIKKTIEDKKISGSNIPEFYQKTEKMHYDKEFHKKSQKTYEKNLEEAKKFHDKEKHKIEAKEPIKHIEKIQEKEIKKPEEAKAIEEKPIEKMPEKKGFFGMIKEKITTTKIDDGQFESLFWDMEIALMENNVAVEVIEKIKNDLKKELVETPIKRTKIEETISASLKNSVESLFENATIDIIHEIKGKKDKPYVITFFGINGSGKTTSIAKIANMLKGSKISCVLAASDTFRAASIEQLQIHADKVGVGMIKHGYGSDPAAVAFDAIKHAKAKKIDAVLIDTAGRMHSNVNLIDELKKINRVTKPDLKIFVGESITGNDCTEQAKIFDDAIGIDGIILAKADVDEKGGAAISVSYVTKKPILYLGTGQEYKDLEPFDRGKIIKNIGLA